LPTFVVWSPRPRSGRCPTSMLNGPVAAKDGNCSPLALPNCASDSPQSTPCGPLSMAHIATVAVHLGALIIPDGDPLPRAPGGSWQRRHQWCWSRSGRSISHLSSTGQRSCQRRGSSRPWKQAMTTMRSASRSKDITYGNRRTPARRRRLCRMGNWRGLFAIASTAALTAMANRSPRPESRPSYQSCASYRSAMASAVQTTGSLTPS